MGTIKATNIEPIADNGTVTLGSSGDTFSLGSGVVQSNLNYPAFMATQNATQNIANNTITKIQFQSKSWDTDSAFDNTTNYRFTIPSGKAGKYVFFYATRINTLGDGDIFQLQIYKNGTLENRSRQISTMGVADNGVIRAQFADDGSVGDYYEVFVQHNYGVARDLNLAFSNFVGYRIGT